MVFERLVFQQTVLTLRFSLTEVCVGGAVAQSVERATPGEEVPGLSPLWPPAPYWLGQYNETVTVSVKSQKSWSPRSLSLVCDSA